MSAAKRGVPKSPEHVAKMAAAQRGKTQSAATVEKRMAQLRGRTHTPEARAKMSAACRRALEAGVLPVPASRRYTALAQALHAHLAAQGLLCKT